MLCGSAFTKKGKYTLLLYPTEYNKYTYNDEILNKELQRLENRARFFDLVVKGELNLANRSKKSIIDQLTTLNFVKKFDEDDGDYDYLLNTPLWSLSQEKIQHLLNEKAKKETELKELEAKTPLDLWKHELISLRKDLEHMFASDNSSTSKLITAKKSRKVDHKTLD
jgi:DNA topoisomerase-2